MRQSFHLVPSWAIQFFLGASVVVLSISLVATVVGTALHGTTGFFDDLGRTVTRIVPQPSADLRSEAQLRSVIAAMPEGTIRVGSVVPEQDRVVFMITADRSAVRASVAPGDEVRIARDGGVEIVPTGVPGLVDRLQRAVDDLRTGFFGR